MKPKHLLLPLLCWIVFNTGASGQDRLNFLDNLSGSPVALFSNATSIFADSNAFIVQGNTALLPQYYSVNYLAGYDYLGQRLWSHKIDFAGRSSIVNGFDLIAKRGSNYICVGTVVDDTINHNILIKYPYIYMFGPNGDSLWFRRYPDTIQTSTISSTAVVENSSMISVGVISGRTIHAGWRGYGYDTSSLWIVKYDSTGDKVWEHNLNSQPNTITPGQLSKVAASTDGMHYLVAASVGTLTAITPTVMSFDTAGTLEWSNPLPVGYPSPYYYLDLLAAPGGGAWFVTSYCGLPYSQFGDRQDYRFLYGRIDAYGDTLWTRTFSRDTLWLSIGLRIARTEDGNLVMSGEASGDNSFRTDNFTRPVLLKTDTLGNVIWYREKLRIRHFGLIQKLPALAAGPGNRILQAGHIETNNAIPSYFDTVGALTWIVLSDSLGLSRDADSVLSPSDILNAIAGATLQPLQMQVYPNPARDYLTVVSPSGLSSTLLALYDMSGRRVLQETIDGGERISLNVQSLPPGRYILRCTANGRAPEVHAVLHE